MSTNSLGLRIVAGMLGPGLKRRGTLRPPSVAGYSVARRVLAGVLGVQLPEQTAAELNDEIVEASTSTARLEPEHADNSAPEPSEVPVRGQRLDGAGAPVGAVKAAASSIVTIRSIQESELDALHRLDRLIYGRLAYPYFTLRQLIDLHGHYCVVVDKGGELVGYCLGGQSAGRSTGWILALGVLPRARGVGYARDLLREVIRRMIADGMQQVQLVVDPDNIPAIHVYEMLGFRITGFRPHYFGPDADRLVMAVTADSVRDIDWSEPDQAEAWLAVEAHDLWIGLDRAHLPI